MREGIGIWPRPQGPNSRAWLTIGSEGITVHVKKNFELFVVRAGTAMHTLVK